MAFIQFSLWTLPPLSVFEARVCDTGFHGIDSLTIGRN
jgi:hypothetical protein